MDEEETKGFCRGCLKYCDEFMELLQYTEKNRRMFVYATGLQVKRTDNFKFQICKDCYLNMRIASKFKKQCRISDRRFKNFLALQGDDDNLDFKTYLRDNPVEFRLPANSTPAHNKTRDEDDSIRNFITDMLQNEEIPDTESVIIRQVLEEETDILEDSLDSNWLRDDISIASDLSLLTSFRADTVKSARSTNKKEIIERDEIFLAMNGFLVPKNKKLESVKTQKNICEKVQQTSTTANIIDNELSNGLNKFTQKRVVLKKDKNISTFNIKIDQTTARKGLKSKVIEKIENGHNNIMFVNSNRSSDKGSECTIDRNLEKALKDEGIQEFSLENLLGSPKDLPGPSTPLINNIILGGNVDNENDSTTSYSVSNAGKFIEKYKVVEGDTVLDDYFREDSPDKDGSVRKKIEIIENEIVNGGVNVENHKISGIKVPIQKPKELEMNTDDALNCDFFEEIQNETLKAKESKKQKVVCDDSKFCLKSFHCKICDNKYKNERALKIHFCHFHKIQIKKANNRKDSKKNMCQKCGMEVLSSRMNMHLKTHEDRSSQCDICKRWFTTKNILRHHMSRHYLPASELRNIADKKKKFLCTICGTKISTYRNYLTHQQRHTKEYTKWCNICGMGFITNYDLSEHSVKHTRDKPFLCNFCPKRYSRKRCLNKHMDSHLDINTFVCKYCSVALMNWDSVKRHRTSKTCLKLRQEMGLENEDYFEAMRSYNRKQLVKRNENCDKNL